MPPRIAYWASSFTPEIEAIASEVACLRGEFPGSVAWGIDSRRWAQISWERGYSFHPRLHWLFRASTWAGQLAFDINHIFGGLADWFHLTAVHKHPTIMTVALADSPCDSKLLGKVDRFVAEWPGAQAKLEKLGIDSNRIRLIYPAVDLSQFQPIECPADPFTVLFASSPERTDWLSARGIDLILGAAQQRPEMRFRLVWRPWGDSLPEIKRLIAQRELVNVELVIGRFSNMASHYQNAHVTMAPFTILDRCKPAPNSIVESLACGRPVVVTSKVGLADLICEHRAGLICEESAESLADALDNVRAQWNVFSKRSRSLAEEHFSQQRFLEDYASLYEELL